jgi:hypothetical protein
VSSPVILPARLSVYRTLSEKNPAMAEFWNNA